MVDNGPALVSTKDCLVPALASMSQSGCRLLFVLQIFRPIEMGRARAVQ